MSHELPACVTDFIRQYLHSVLDIETLLLLRSRPEALWSARDLGSALYITAEAASEHLAKLHANGLLCTWDGGTPAVLYRYDVQDETIAREIGRAHV